MSEAIKGEYVATEFNVEVIGENEEHIIYQGRNMGVPAEDAFKATTQLLATAPDMLEICEAFLERANDMGFSEDEPISGADTVDFVNDILSAFVNVIKKAKGESNG